MDWSDIGAAVNPIAWASTVATKYLPEWSRRLPVVGQVKDVVDPSTAGEDQANQLAAMYENLKYTDPSSDPKYAAALDQLRSYSTGGLTAADRAREYEALGEANNFASGQTGEIAQDAAARGGGGVGVNQIREQVAAQGAAKRLGEADVNTAGMAAQRALMAQQEFARQMQINSEMQNQFALMKAGGQAGAIKNLQDIKEREAAAQNANRDALTNELASLAMGAPLPKTATAAPTSSQIAGVGSNLNLPSSGYVPQDGYGGFRPPVPLPGASADAASAAAKAYSDSLNFPGEATPGGAPSFVAGSFDPNNPARKVGPPSY